MSDISAPSGSDATNAPAPISTLRCIKTGEAHDVTTSRFTSRAGDLLAVDHDLAALGQRYPDLVDRFDARAAELTGPYASGVWRYHELILPDLPRDAIVSLPEGNTALYRRAALERYIGVDTLCLKHEGENPTLSFKDRGMTAGVSWAKHVGARRVACASTGDTSAAMAAFAAAAELPAVVLLPHEKVSAEQLAQPVCYGAQVLALQTDFDGCMKLVKSLTDSGEIYLLNSMNPFRIEGQKAIGIELLHQLGWQVPDWIVIPVGNAGNISALGKGLAELHTLGIIDKLPRLAGAQAAGANPLARAHRAGYVERVRVTAERTVASAIQIGDPVSYDKAVAVVEKLTGLFADATDDEAMHAKAAADAAGVHVCPNSGVALAVAKKLRAAGTIAAGDSVAIIATAHGAKFSRAAADYHAAPSDESGGDEAGSVPFDGERDLRNPVRVLPAELDAVRAAL